ncbi:DUF5722 domain-containing protein [Lachnospiraceae bacterium 54-53]
MKKINIGRIAAGMLAAAFLCGASAFVSLADEVIAGAQATIQSCLINSDRNSVTVLASNSGSMEGTDGVLYLVEMQPYQSNLEGRTDYAASSAPGETVKFTFPLNRNTVDDKLYSRFVVAVWDGTKYIEISKPHYITNPEMVAANTQPFSDPLTKKGLNIQLNMLGDAFELGVKHVATNISFHQILGQGIDYQFDGKTYHFDKNAIASYDETISALSGKGMTVTAIILNGWNDATPDLIYPGTKKNANAFYYMFNVATQNGLDQTRAIASFLAERYNGSNPNYGKISNWIIGNEINNQQWNHMGERDLTSYVQAYQDAFRVFYTAIKSTSANDRVYFSLDYNWNNEIDNKLKYGGKDVVDTFNSIANEQGQMDWGLSYHPYPCPMTEPEFWDDDQTGLITSDFNSPVINFKNLTTLTDYMAQDCLKSPTGHVRHIILTEQGFTATSLTRGKVDQIQAAAYAYSYYMVDSNPYIDAYILSRQVDAPLEVRSGLSFGLWECAMDRGDDIVATKRRKIWQVFRNIDKKKYTLENTEFAKSIIGIEKWSDVIPNFRWRSLEN